MLLFYLAGEFATGSDPARMRGWNDRWQYGGFRHAMRVMTAIWGGMYLADVMVRVGLVFILSTTVFIVVSQVLFYVMFAATFLATIGLRPAGPTPRAHPA